MVYDMQITIVMKRGSLKKNIHNWGGPHDKSEYDGIVLRFLGLSLVNSNGYHS